MARKRKTRNVDVVKTERDSRRATKELDDAFDLTDDEVTDEPTSYVSLGMSRYRRAKARKTAPAVPEQPFRFNDLPPEVRNEIYGCIVVSNADAPISLSGDYRSFAPGGIETAILRTSRQTYSEAIKILHERNRFQVYGSYHFGLNDGAIFRVDDPHDAGTTSRQLRSGRSVGRVDYQGLIHKEVFYRLRYVEFHLDLFSRDNHCDWMVANSVMNLQDTVRAMRKNITDASSPEMSILRPEETNWTFVIHATAKLGPRSFELSLEPLFVPEIIELVHKGKLKMELRGPFPPGWETFFKDMMCDNFSTEYVEELGEVGEDPGNLDAIVKKGRESYIRF